MSKPVAILCSGVALGVYIPALLMNYQLKKQNIPTEVMVLENLIIDEKRQKINENKMAFHKSFQVALMGQKMARDVRPSLDAELLNGMFEHWKNDGIRDFIVFSGFWMPLIEDFKALISPENINVEICHMDADISASWKAVQGSCQSCNNIWLFSWEKKGLLYEMPVSSKKPVPFGERPNRYVIHGGGWGMGTYQSKIPELKEKGFSLDIVAYDIKETLDRKDGDRYFMVDPAWSPWFKNKDGQHEFPMFGEILPPDIGSTTFDNREEYHELFDVISQCRAIISKPGGATLLDSLASATPIIMLDPFGKYEGKNAELWDYMVFGIPYDRWKEMNFSIDAIEKMHNNLLRTRGTLINYSKDYARRLGME